MGPVALTLGEFADELGVHCSEPLAEWFVRNGVTSTVTMPPWEKDEDMVVRLMRDKGDGSIHEREPPAACGPASKGGAPCRAWKNSRQS